MMLSEPEPPILVRHTLLLAVRDGFERITMRPGPSGCWYDMFGFHGGEGLELCGPTTEAAQEFPAILAGLGPRCGLWGRVGLWGRRQVRGSGSGEFVFPVGPGFVSGSYRLQWDRGMVAELEITVPLATEAVAEAARGDLRESARAVWGEEEDAASDRVAEL